MVKGIDRLIICNPYQAPTKYYKFDPEHDRYHMTDGRRPSGYQSMSESGTYGEHVEIDSVNKIRKLVDVWRDKGYPGTTKTTRTLLNHWKYRDENRLFFCQLEAIETIIYAAGHQNIIDSIIKDDDGPFIRHCTKMATGTGKTIVMAMLIVWQVLNTGSEYTKNILVVTPNLTVKDRLAELQPGNPDNIYDKFDLVPPFMKDMLGGSNIVITNFHQLKPKHENKRSVAKLGTQGARSFAASIIGKDASRILVINDEGHHAWRPSLYKNADRYDSETAGVWMSGLDIMHKACTIMRCHDFSATPFVPTGKSSTDDTLFSWIISDFSLSDAIESGLVKTPRTPASGDRFHHLYQKKEVRGPLGRSGIVKLPPLVVEAYRLLGGGWENTYQRWRATHTTPPVMITVCNSTKHAKIMVGEFKTNRIGLNENLTKTESMLHIDSDVIKAVESDTGKKEIRDRVSTVGKVGQLGEKICNIISVNMLTEGWDARTVTHIMGLRAFKSQLLCEQVVGRGLRRTSYDINDYGLFGQEYVDILGVPFGGILSETGSGPGPTNGVEPQEIFPDKPQHIVSWPIVKDIQDVVEYHTDMNLDRITPPEFGKTPTPSVDLGPVIDGRPAAHDKTLEMECRKQTMIYTILGEVMEEYRGKNRLDLAEYSPYNDRPYQTTIDVLDIIKRYVKKFVDTARLDEQGRIVLLSKYQNYIARHISKNLVKCNPASGSVAEIKGTGSTNMPRKFTTKKRTQKTKKTHLNIMTADSDLEMDICKYLEADARVLSWAKSDMAGFSIPYTHPDGTDRIYKPDFIAHLNTGVQLIIEGKGKEDAVDKAKKVDLQKWTNVVNLNGRYGIWDAVTIYGDRDVNTSLDDAIRLTSECKHNHTCERCGLATDILAESVRLFGLVQARGILKIRTICNRCQDSIKSNNSSQDSPR